MSKLKSLKCFFVALVLLFSALLISFVNEQYAYADTANNFDDSAVLDDLQDSVINGKQFDVANYPANAFGTVDVLTFVEYCFSQYENGFDNYALYVYIYNPAKLNLSESVGLNKIQLATVFDSSGNATTYNKFQLEFCSKSDGIYNKLFYKYKVIDVNNEILSVVKSYAVANQGVRRYHVSGVELLTIGERNAIDYYVATSFEYAGFADGYGNSEDFPLTCNVYDIDTLEFSVKSTYYRPEGANFEGSGTQDQLNSVYFSVPNDILNKFGSIVSVHMEWYEYLTKEVFVTSNYEIYNHYENYLGVKIGRERNPDGPGSGTYIVNPDVFYAFLGYSPYAPVYNYYRIEIYPVIETLYYMFYSGSISALDYSISSDDFLSYIDSYSQNHMQDIQGKYSSDLFEDYVDNGRTYGYNNVEITIDGRYDLISYVLEKQNLIEQIFGIKNYSSSEYNGIEAIVVVDYDDLSLSKSSFCDKYFIATSDYSDFIQTCKDAQAKNESVFSVRYAVTEYFSWQVYQGYEVSVLGYWKDFEILSDDSYIAQQTVFLDLDIIDVTFFKDNKTTVIPVVASPIDVFNEITPPVNVPRTADWLQIILIIIATILIITILNAFFKMFKKSR